MECFCVNSQEIENRIDPHFYRPEFKLMYKKLSKIKLVSFGEIIKTLINGFDYRDFTEDGLTYLRVSNIKPFEFYLDEVKKISPNFDITKKIKLEKGNLLLTRKGTFGVALSLDKDEDFIICSEIFKIELIDKINPKFVEIILNSPIGQKQFDKYKIGAIMGSLSQEAVKQIKIPLPSLEIQNKIVSLMDKAYSSKKLKETESQKLIDSINDYVLDELGIKLLKSEDKMCFTVSFEEVETGRIDPISFAHPQDTPSSEKFKEKSLGEVTKLVKGQSITKENITSGDYPVIAGGQSSPYSIDKFNHKGNIITVSASGAYSGYVWYHDYPIFASDCTVIKSLEEKEISTFYLFCVMKAKQKFVYNMQQGAGQPHVYSRDLSKLNIPLPSLSVQNKIADEVKKRMQKAETLQKEAKEELEKAKLEVEKIILG